MNENRRIFWNVVATYGRSLFALLCGVFTARWVLNALGTVDYGLFGVVGGLVVFISFLNNTLSTANSRFYSVAIGQARSAEDKDRAIEECRKWFNIALTIHSVVPIVVVAIGYPIGIWAVKNFLTIPPDRVSACVWVFRLACVSCLVNMMSVPFGAMYRAKQLIAELTIYGYATTLVNVACLYYMATHPSDWLVRYAIFTMILAVVPQLLIAGRALFMFQECKIITRYLINRAYFRQVVAFAGWELLGSICQLLRTQGVSIAVNKFFGPGVNAAMALGNSVDANASALSASLTGAFQPAIANAYGEGNLEKMRLFAYRACKFGTLMQLVFFIPLVAELPQILKLWLKTPPQYTTFLCIVALASHLLTSSTQGHYSAFSACGKMREYQINMSGITILTLPAVLVALWFGAGVYGLGVVLVAAMACLALRRVYYAERFTGLSAAYWFRRIMFPIAVVSAMAGLSAILPRLIMPETLTRILVSTITSEIVLLPLAWIMVLDRDEKSFVLEKIAVRFPSVRRLVYD